MNKVFFSDLSLFLIKVLKNPFLFILSTSILSFAWVFLSQKYNWVLIPELAFLPELKNAVIFITLYWIIYNATQVGSRVFLEWASSKNYTLLFIIFPPIHSSLNGALFIVMLNMLLFSLNIQGSLGLILAKSAKIMLIIVIASVIYKIICSLERYIINKYIENNADISNSRKINTQLTILKRIIVFILVLLTFVAITMLFDSVRGLGTSLLTTAGIISAVGAFASQQSLGRLFAGLQLAFTQPMRLGDTVIIDHEFGQVEEITLSFITVKLWDLRRLILPTDYFTNKGLLNLTRESSELLGTIFLYADYTLPVDLVRSEFIELLKKSIYWNKRVGTLEVTDMKESTMEIRCLVSADDAGNLWKLRCDIREKLIKYIVEHHHSCLTKTRSLSLNNLSGSSMKSPATV
jgi:small-conductance mechanosensitive channel